MVYIVLIVGIVSGFDVDEMNSWLAEAATRADAAPSEWWSGDTLIQPLDGEAEFWGGDLAVLGGWEWVQWPSQEYVQSHPIRDRSAEFPPVYLSPDHRGQGFPPLRGGAGSPERGVAQLVGTVRERMLEDTWSDSRQDIHDLVVLVQEQNPGESLALARLELSRATIQITVEQWGQCIVIRPASEDYIGLTHLELGQEVFRRMFLYGDAMAERPLRLVEESPDGVSVFVPEGEWDHGYRDWSLWYTDGEAMAVFFCTFDYERSMPNHLLEPWF